MMTRKDYIQVAKILNENLAGVSDEMLNEFIKMFKADNSRFDSNRFVNAVKGN
jgi:hypothetical protein